MLLGECIKTKYAASPIKKYNIDQTGPKIQFGGFQVGLIKNLYQVLMLFVVEIPERKPNNNGEKIIINFLINSINTYNKKALQLLQSFKFSEIFVALNSRNNQYLSWIYFIRMRKHRAISFKYYRIFHWVAIYCFCYFR